MNPKENISDRFLAIRKAHGFSQTELALELGISLSYIHQLESGKRGEPSASLLKLLDLWEKVNHNKEARAAEAAKTEEPRLQEKAERGYQATPHQIRAKSGDLMERVAKLASASGLSEDLIVSAAITQFIAQCEKAGAVSLPISGMTSKPPIKNPDKPPIKTTSTDPQISQCEECIAE